MSGVAGVSVQARDIHGGVHLHLTVSDPFRSGAARQVELDERTADALAVALRDLDVCLTALGVPGPDLPNAVDQVTRAVLLQFQREHDPTPPNPPAVLTPALRRFARDLAAYVEPERLLTTSFYFSTRKVVAFHRAYQCHLADDRPLSPEQRFLALHRYFRSRDRLLFGPAHLLPGTQPADDAQWVFFTGDFTLVRDDGALDQVPNARQALDAGKESYHVVTAVFGARDPFFYPYVEFNGRVSTMDAVMTVSRKHLVLNSNTVTALTLALRGAPLAVAGFGTLAPADSGVQIHPIVFRAERA